MCAHNATALKWHEQQGLLGSPVYNVYMQHDGAQAKPVNVGHVSTWLRQQDFHVLTHVAVGARVMYTTNSCKATGATNSKQGTVVDIIFAEQWPEGMQPPTPGERWVESLRVALDGGKTVTARRSLMDNTCRNIQVFSKRTFPLMLAYAMTAHK